MTILFHLFVVWGSELYGTEYRTEGTREISQRSLLHDLGPVQSTPTQGGGRGH